MFEFMDFAVGRRVEYNNKDWIILKTLGGDMYLAVEDGAPLPAPTMVIKATNEDIDWTRMN